MTTPTFNTSSIVTPIVKPTVKQINEKVDTASKIRNNIQSQANIILKLLK